MRDVFSSIAGRCMRVSFLLAVLGVGGVFHSRVICRIVY